MVARFNRLLQWERKGQTVTGLKNAAHRTPAQNVCKTMTFLYCKYAVCSGVRPTIVTEGTGVKPVSQGVLNASDTGNCQAGNSQSVSEKC
jgi:hypothetical protein